MACSSKIALLLGMIKFEHTIFALPFAYMGMLLGARGLPDGSTFLWVTLAMVGARTYAMALNRLFDRHIDRRNPRTRSWPLPQGLVSVSETIMLAGAALGLFAVSVMMLPPLTHVLWPAVLLPMTLYSLAKRFTVGCHFILGLCLGLAPLGAWVATTNTLPVAGIWLLGLAIMCWTAGFDIIYACQDRDFDRREGLHSFPARYGIGASLVWAKVLHGLTVTLLLLTGIVLSLGLLYGAGVACIAGFLWYENAILSPGDLSRINVSFFTLNGFVSIAAFFFTWAALRF
jgi:4-hydroxybenzoate polyprenyltransferase